MDTRRNTTKVELLAPAGSFETLQAVIAAGADAVYIGGTRFGARAYADNPEEDRLLQAIDHAHLRGARVYLTVNTLLTDREMGDLYAYIEPYYRAGLDAVIVQDLGVLSFLRSHFPDLPVHVSTQMTVADAEAADLFDRGVTRIVPARELSLSEIRDMRVKCDRELEIFVHGALCYCYSGQCLMSSLIGGRSGNRGRCAQPCRKNYTYTEGSFREDGYVLSLRDQCLLPKLHELLETGIHSLKIEGRMKRLEYAAGVTAIYRKWIDRYYALGPDGYRAYLAANQAEMKDDITELADLYNRGGFCEGYVFGEKGPSMVYTKRPNHSGVLVGTARVRVDGRRRFAVPEFRMPVGGAEVIQVRSADEEILGEWTTPKETENYRIDAIPVTGQLSAGTTVNLWRMRREPLLTKLAAQYGKPKEIPVRGLFVAVSDAEMSFSVGAEGTDDYPVTVTGPVPEAAKQNPATEEDIRGKLTRTGGTSYVFKDLDIVLGDGLFVPASVLNRMRREALEMYENECLRRFRREIKNNSSDRSRKEERKADGSFRVTVSVMKKEQLEAALRCADVTDLYIDMEGDFEACLEVPTDLPRRFILPRALRGAKRDAVLSKIAELVKKYQLAGVVVRTPDQMAFATKEGVPFETDKTLYCMNSTSVEYLTGKGAGAVTFSEELRKDELPLSERALLTVYGRSLAMVSEQCPRKTLGLCGKDGSRGILTDGEGEHFPTLSVCRYCHGLIFNSHVMSLLPVWEEIPRERIGGVRLDMTLESADETAAVIKDLETVLRGGRVSAAPGETKGSWNRGVE